MIYSASVPLSCDIVSDIFHRRNLPVDELIIRETVDAVCSGNPVQRAIQKGGPLSTAYLRKQYYKENFSVIEGDGYRYRMTSKPVTPLAPHERHTSFVLFIGYWLTCLRGLIPRYHLSTYQFCAKQKMLKPMVMIKSLNLLYKI